MTQAAIAAGENPKFSALKTIAATPFPVATCGLEPSPSQEEPLPDSMTHDLLIFPDGIRVHGLGLDQGACDRVTNEWRTREPNYTHF
jgi:hypothetical protein